MIVGRIKEFCKKNNITLAQLEKDLNFGNGTIRRWDDSLPSISKVIQVAQYFNVSVDELIKGYKGEQKDE